MTGYTQMNEVEMMNTTDDVYGSRGLAAGFHYSRNGNPLTGWFIGHTSREAAEWLVGNENPETVDDLCGEIIYATYSDVREVAYDYSLGRLTGDPEEVLVYLLDGMFHPYGAPMEVAGLLFEPESRQEVE